MQWWPHWTLKSRYQNCSLFHGHWRACANLGRVHAWLHHQGGGRLGEFTVCTVCIEKQKTTKNGQMAAGRVKMSERVN